MLESYKKDCNANSNVFPRAKLLKSGSPTGCLKVGLDVNLHIFVYVFQGQIVPNEWAKLSLYWDSFDGHIRKFLSYTEI